jgi:hypothetical protein
MNKAMKTRRGQGEGTSLQGRTVLKHQTRKALNSHYLERGLQHLRNL